MTQVQVAGIGDGTRDQLHLALRLSCLERHLQSSELMPLIVDDILLRFDDDRANAALEVLATLSGATQVNLPHTVPGPSHALLREAIRMDW